MGEQGRMECEVVKGNFSVFIEEVFGQSDKALNRIALN